jgi:hypothetical protein
MYVVVVRVTSLMKLQFVLHTLRQTEIPALLDSGVTNAPLSKFFVHKKLLVLIVW